MPRVHASQSDTSHQQHQFSEDVKPGRTDLSWAPQSTRGLGLARWVGLGTGMGVVRRTRTAPDYLHPAAQTEPWPRPGRRRSTRRVPRQKQRRGCRRPPRNRPHRTLPETARAAAPASELCHVRGGAGPSGLTRKGKGAMQSKSHVEGVTCPEPG